MRDTAPLSQRSRERAVSADLRGKRTWRASALWVTLGIVGVAICCQAVGFPSLVADTPHAGDPIETGSLPSLHRVDRARCTSLVLDRRGNRTLAGRCPEDGLVLRLEGESDRDDLPLIAGNEAR